MQNLKAIISIYENQSFFHEVEDGEIGPATNLSMDAIKHVFIKNLNINKVKMMDFKSIIPSNVLSFDPFAKSIIFYTQPCYRKMLFQSSLKIPNAHYKQPFLLWKYADQKLYVWALKTKPKSEDDVLYQAPFMNVSGNGSVCMGTTHFETDLQNFDDLMVEVVDKFYNSIFTHTNENRLLAINYMDFLKNHAYEKDFKFTHMLIKKQITIKDIL